MTKERSVWAMIERAKQPMRQSDVDGYLDRIVVAMRELREVAIESNDHKLFDSTVRMSMEVTFLSAAPQRDALIARATSRRTVSQ